MDKYPWQARERARKAVKKEVKPRPMLAKESAKTKTDNKIHALLKKDFLKDNPVCQCTWPECIALPVRPQAVDLHHMEGRGVNLNEVSTFMAMARRCHSRVKEESAAAMALGMIKSRMGPAKKKINL